MASLIIPFLGHFYEKNTLLHGSIQDLSELLVQSKTTFFMFKLSIKKADQQFEERCPEVIMCTL